MNDTLRTALIGVFAILAIALAAVSLDAPTVDRGDSGSNGAGNGEGGYITPTQPEVMPGDVIEIPFVVEIFTLLYAIFAIILIMYVIFYWRQALGLALAILAFFGLVILLSQFYTPPDIVPMPSEMEPDNETGPVDGGGGEEIEPRSPFSWVFLVLLGIALMAMVAIVLKTGLVTDPDQVDPEGGDDPTPTAVSMGRAAGRAADRLEAEDDFDNGVYRAWLDMTALLEIDNPEASTPGEFADAAAEVGLGREDANELTRLFEDVRYGGTDPTDDDERRAIAIFRRIESRYAEGEE